MLENPDQVVDFPRPPFLVTVIAEPPGALAIMNRDIPPWDPPLPWCVTIRLELRRGRHFSRNNDLVRTLRLLHAQNELARVLINLPERYVTAADIEQQLARDPELAPMLDIIERAGMPSALTTSSRWRPFLDQPYKGSTYSSVMMEAYMEELLKNSDCAEHQLEQCAEAVMLGNFTNNAVHVATYGTVEPLTAHPLH